MLLHNCLILFVKSKINLISAMRKPIKRISGSKSINRKTVGISSMDETSLWIKLPKNCVINITNPQIRIEPNKKTDGQVNSSTVLLTPNTHEPSRAGSFVLSYKTTKNPKKTKKGMARIASNVRGINIARNSRDSKLGTSTPKFTPKSKSSSPRMEEGVEPKIRRSSIAMSTGKLTDSTSEIGEI